MLRLTQAPDVLTAKVARRHGGFHQAVGEVKLRASPATHEAPWAAVSASLIPVPPPPQEEDDLPAPTARQRQTSTYPYPSFAHDLPLWCIRSVPPSLTLPGVSGQ